MCILKKVLIKDNNSFNKNIQDIIDNSSNILIKTTKTDENINEEFNKLKESEILLTKPKKKKGKKKIIEESVNL